MKVRVIKAALNSYWYAQYIGEVFDVEECNRYGCKYQVVGENRYFVEDDVEVVSYGTYTYKQPKFPFKVKCIDITNAEHDLVLNAVYTVTGQSAGDYYLKETPWSYRKSRFEIVKEENVDHVEEALKSLTKLEKFGGGTLSPQVYVPDAEEERRVLDAHYSFNYTLTDADREKGVIKVDPYFVAKQWQLGSKDDTGVLFHCLKNISRYSDKNSKEREIKALNLQIKRLAELEGVSLD